MSISLEQVHWPFEMVGRRCCRAASAAGAAGAAGATSGSRTTRQFFAAWIKTFFNKIGKKVEDGEFNRTTF